MGKPDHTQPTHTRTQTMKNFFLLILAVLALSTSAFTPAAVSSRRSASKVSQIDMIFGKKEPTGKVMKVPKAVKKTGKTVVAKSGGDNAWQAGSFGYSVPGTPSKGNSEVYKLKRDLSDMS